MNTEQPWCFAASAMAASVSAPSVYLRQIEDDRAVQLSTSAMDAILHTHCINPGFLRTDDFEGFFQDRRATLLSLVEQAMGKQAVVTSEPVFDAEEEDQYALQ